jgi:hypothetical protein
MMELFIEGQLVDLSDVHSTVINYQIDDITDFGSRNTNFTKQFILPGTARNNKIFGSIFDVESADPYDSGEDNVFSNFNASVNASCIVFQDHIQVIKGVLRLLLIRNMAGSIEYEVAVFGELSGLAAAIGNKKLEDIANQYWNIGGDYITDYTIANIEASWNLVSGDGIRFPLIDYGNYSVNKHDWDYKTFRPCLCVRDYITRILNDTGYRYECDLFDTSRFVSLIVPYNGAVLTTLDDEIATLSYSGSQTVNNSTLPKVKFTAISTAAFTANVANDQFTYTGSDSAGIVVRIRATVTGNVDLSIVKYDSGGTPIVTAILAQATTSLDETLDIGFGLVTGEKISITTNFTAYSNTSATLTDATLDVTSLVPVQVPLSLGNTFNIRDIIPKGVFQLDFFKSIITLFNLYVYESAEEERKIFIKPYVDFYDTDPANAKDWTNKLDRKSWEIKPMGELNARFHEFKFKPDTDFYNDFYNKKYSETYGSRLYDSEYQFSGDRHTTEIIFSGTPLVGYSGEDKVYSTIFKKNGSTEEQINSNIRILQAKKITGVSSWDIKDGATVLGSYTKYGYAGHLDDPDAPSNDINFGVPKELFFTLATGNLSVNQFNVYWSPYMAEITHKDSKLFTGKFYLNSKDISELDFSKLIYMDSALWRLNKIEDYNVTYPELSTVTLLKVIHTIY